VAPSQTSQIPTNAEPGSLSSAQSQRENEVAQSPLLVREEEELVEQDIRDRFKRMCEGYFDNVCKKLVIEHKVGDMPTFEDKFLISSTFSGCKNKTRKTMKRTYVPVKYLRIVSKRTRK
jgi:hypothetical protein